MLIHGFTNVPLPSGQSDGSYAFIGEFFVGNIAITILTIIEVVVVLRRYMDDDVKNIPSSSPSPPPPMAHAPAHPDQVFGPYLSHSH